MESKNKKKIILVTVAAILLIAAAVIILFCFRSRITATTMRILRIEGEVKLEENGKDKTVRDNIRLNSDNALSTAADSLVSIGLDDTKIVTLDELSRAVFNKIGRKLHLDLTDGSMYVEVTKPLEADESLDVETSTMIVGIRGTSVWISAEGDHDSIIVTDGHIHLIGRNPVTGEIKEIDVYAGQRVRTYTYNDREVDSIMFVLEPITEHDLPPFVLDYLREHPDLLDKVVSETHWDKDWIQGLVKDEKKTEAPAVTVEPATEETADDSEKKKEGEESLEEASEPASKAADVTPQDPAPDEAQIVELLELLAKAQTQEPVIITPQEEWDSGNDDDDDDEDDDEDDDDDDDSSSDEPVSNKSNISCVNSSSTYDSSQGIDFMFEGNVPGKADYANGKIVAMASVNIKVPFILTDTGGNETITAGINDIRTGDTDMTVNVVYPVGNTDVVRTVIKQSGNPTTEYYTYGNSSYRYEDYQPDYTGTDGETYIRLSNPTSGPAETFICVTGGKRGTVTTTPP